MLAAMLWPLGLSGRRTPAHSLAGCAGPRPSSAHSGLRFVFGREGRLGTRTIRITAKGENRTHDTVSTVSRVSDHGDRASLNNKPSSARTGTGALIVQTMLTVVTQNSRLTSRSVL
jgi:hypothetical protein